MARNFRLQGVAFFINFLFWPSDVSTDFSHGAMEHFFAVAGNVSRICRLCISPLEVLGGEPKKGALNFHELLAIKSCYRKEVWTPTTRVRHNRAGGGGARGVAL